MSEKPKQWVEQRRLLPPACLLISVVLMVSLRFFLPGARILMLPWTLLGLLPLVIGVGLNLLADQALKRHKTTVKPFEKSMSLVTDSVYAISRNPMYLGFTLILLGVAIFLGAITPFLVALAFPLWMQRAFIRVEESMMNSEFGSAWSAYQAKTRSWI